jgi:hypothetical protein
MGNLWGRNASAFQNASPLNLVDVATESNRGCLANKSAQKNQDGMNHKDCPRCQPARQIDLDKTI